LAVWRSVSHEPLHTEDPHFNFHEPRVNLHYLRERLTAYITDAVHNPPQR